MKLSGLSHITNNYNDPNYGLCSHFFCDRQFQAPECWKGAASPPLSSRRFLFVLLRRYVVSGRFSLLPLLSPQRHSLREPHGPRAEQRELLAAPRHGEGVSGAAVVAGAAAEPGGVGASLSARRARRSEEMTRRRNASGSGSMDSFSRTWRRKRSRNEEWGGVVGSRSPQRRWSHCRGHHRSVWTRVR